MPKPVRRVVTGRTPEGRSTILMDEAAPQAVSGADAATGHTVLWATQQSPASNAGNDDAAPAGVTTPVPPPWRGGSVFGIVDFPPGLRARHKTDTLDYAIVLEGEIWAILDDAETLMKPGDVLIQRGTFHAWDNRSEHVARVAMVLLDADPVSD